MAKAKSKADTFAKDVQDVLIEKIKKAELKTLVEYGIYTTLGIITFVALGKVQKYPAVRKGTAKAIAMDTRQMLVDMTIGMREVALIKIPLTAARPLIFLDPIPKWIVRVIGVAEDDLENPGVINYLAVPLPYRALLAIMLPSLLYITIETLKGTIELG